LVVLLVAAGCTSPPPTPETVIETVVHTREVPVTRVVQVTNQIEVTRLVEVTREVEVTRLLEVTRLVEMTVERVVTATPEPTPTPLPPTEVPPTPIPVPTVPSVPVAALLDSMQTAREDMRNFAGLIDVALREGYISCQQVVDLYAKIVNAPTYDVSAGSPVVQNAYGAYRAAIDIFATGARDMNQNCSDFLASGGSGTGIPFQQWGMARDQVDEALKILDPAIESLQ
jgi:hypothetical protein